MASLFGGLSTFNDKQAGGHLFRIAAGILIALGVYRWWRAILAVVATLIVLGAVALYVGTRPYGRDQQTFEAVVCGTRHVSAVDRFVDTVFTTAGKFVMVEGVLDNNHARNDRIADQEFAQVLTYHRYVMATVDYSGGHNPANVWMLRDLGLSTEGCNASNTPAQ